MYILTYLFVYLHLYLYLNVFGFYIASAAVNATPEPRSLPSSNSPAVENGPERRSIEIEPGVVTKMPEADAKHGPDWKASNSET